MRFVVHQKRPVRLWLKTHEYLARKALLWVGIAAAVSIVFQLAYPSGRTLPFVNAGGARVGNATNAHVAKDLEAYYKGATLTIQTGNKKTTKTLQEIGVDIDATATATSAVSYAWWERLIPFSSVGIMIGRNVDPVSHYDKERITYFAKTLETESFVPAKNASLGVEKGKAVVLPAKPSESYGSASFISIVYNTAFRDKTTVQVAAVTKPAARSDEQVEKTLPAVQKMIDRPITITLPDKKSVVSKETLITWIDFAQDSRTKQLKPAVNQEAIARYAAGLKAKVDKVRGTTTISIVDGAEAKRSASGDGLGVDEGRTVLYLQQALDGTGKTDVVVPVAVLPAWIVYERSYSATSKGLGVLLGDVASAKGGYGMAVAEIGGHNRSGSANGDKQFTSASTYKLFVAYGVFKRINAGSMHWSDIIYGGKTAEKCFDDMIVVSDNNCAVAFANIIGWSNIQTMMTNVGLTHTQTKTGDQLTTANDLALYLQKLQDGSLLSSSDRSRLLSAMERNIYRSGIPAGVNGAKVADKVGFIDGYLNDAAIVYGPKTTYVLVILSKSSTWANIADATKQIDVYFNQ